MSSVLRRVISIGIALWLLFGVTACDLFQKKIPPNDLFRKAETQRKNDNILEAAQLYDELLAQHPDSELVPAALYYAGLCKYALSIRTPGKKEFTQRKDGLSEIKQALYTQWIEYVDKHDQDFLYAEAIDKYLYKGTQFKTVLEDYAASNLADDAAFRLIQTHLLAKQRTNTFTIANALQLYTDYFTHYPQSPYRAKGAEHLLQLIAEHSGTILNHDEIVAAYQALPPEARDLPEMARLAYTLGTTFIEEADLTNAAALLGVPHVIGLGIVDTKRTRLNIRSGQGTEYRIAAKADKGDLLILLSKSGQWYHVQLQDGTIGYAHADFIQESQAERRL